MNILLLKIFRGIWISACIAAGITGIYNAFKYQSFCPEVYFPFICTALCTLVVWNISSQIRFKEKRK